MSRFLVDQSKNIDLRILCIENVLFVHSKRNRNIIMCKVSIFYRFRENKMFHCTVNKKVKQNIKDNYPYIPNMNNFNSDKIHPNKKNNENYFRDCTSDTYTYCIANIQNKLYLCLYLNHNFDNNLNRILVNIENKGRLKIVDSINNLTSCIDMIHFVFYMNKRYNFSKFYCLNISDNFLGIHNI